jgi:hypothetical protein
MRLIARIHGTYGVLVELDELLADTSIRQLAQLVQKRLAGADAGAPGTQEEVAGIEGEYHPLDDLQLPFWNVSKLRTAKHAYNEAVTYLIEGDLDLDVCRQVLARFLASQPALRTSFAERPSGPVQKVLRPESVGPIPLEERDLCGNTDPMSVCEALFREIMATDFDFSHPPLVRAFVWRIAARRWVVGCVLPHLISDHWSVEVIAESAVRWYRELRLHTTATPAPISDGASKQAAARAALTFSVEDEQFWLEKMSRRPAHVEIGTRRRPAIKSYQGDMLRRTLHLGGTSILEPARAAYGATSASLMFAAFGLLIAIAGQANEVTIGVPVLLRHRSETEDLIGLFLNTLPITIEADDNLRIGEFVAECHARWTAALAHGRYPVHRLLEKLSVPTQLNRSPLFEYHFTYYERPPIGAAGAQTGLEASALELAAGTSKFDLTFFITREADELWCKADYCTALFRSVDIEQLIEKYQAITSLILQQPQMLLSEVRGKFGAGSPGEVAKEQDSCSA